MTVIYMQGQSPFHPDPMDVAITDEMGRYIEDVQKFNAKQARELNDAKNAIQIHRGEADCAMWPTSQPRAAEAATHLAANDMESAAKFCVWTVLLIAAFAFGAWLYMSRPF